jgi:hypothetical protein
MSPPFKGGMLLFSGALQNAKRGKAAAQESHLLGKAAAPGPLANFTSSRVVGIKRRQLCLSCMEKCLAIALTASRVNQG